MKHILSFLLFIFPILMISHSNAQLIKSYGIHIGISSANQEYSSSGSYFPLAEIDLKRKVGFVGGVYLEWLNVPYISFMTQVEYVQKGMGVESIVTGQSGPEPIGKRTEYSRLDYMSLPMLLKISIQTSVVNPYILSGPRYDYLLGYQTEFMNNIYDEFEKNVWGGTIGIGIETNLSQLFEPSIELRYNFDFTDSLKLEDKECKNNSFDIRFCFKL